MNEAGGNYHLLATSPAIDAGTSQDAPTADIDGNPRPSGKGYDIGAYEYQGQVLPPSPPTNLSATAGSGDIVLSWTAGNNDASYNVYRSTTPGFAVSPSTLITSPQGTAYTDAQVMANTTYYYLVTGLNAANKESLPSNQASATDAADTTPPTVTVTAPANNATVQGTISVSASAKDDGVVTGVQFALDGTNLGFCPRATVDVPSTHVFALETHPVICGGQQVHVPVNPLGCAAIQQVEIVFFDTTSLYFEGQGGESLGQHGYSKDHRPDL